ncbi:hypothetical protein EAI_02214 [Harpegnathos saltator]|uniref:RRM domain-containing protein n=1 Tax=Harpegnathos saltator TaxID=610380 RepID=E2BLR6_HARSA|nr:hypothetical protein EAI_02214 [Harpegnathos saltator]
MHKGYAFVQFTNPFDARSACLGEDGRTVLSQILGGCGELLGGRACGGRPASRPTGQPTIGIYPVARTGYDTRHKPRLTKAEPL